MKLELSQKINIGLYYAIAAIDVLFLLLIFFLLGSSFVLQPGVKVELPFSTSTMHPKPNMVVITIQAGSPPLIFYNGAKVEFNELDSLINLAFKDDKNIIEKTSIIQADKNVSFGIVFEISNLLLQKGFELSYATTNELSN